MIKYAKVLNEETGQVEIGYEEYKDFYAQKGFILLDVKQSDIDGKWYLSDKCPMKTNEEKEAEKRHHLDQRTLTPSDVERALYSAKGIDFDDLKKIIAEKMQIDEKALNIEFRASLFYRGATLGEDGPRLFDVIGALLDYTPDDMDYLFENKRLPEKDNQNPELLENSSNN